MINVQTNRLTSPGSAWNNAVKSSQTRAKLPFQKRLIRKHKLLFFSPIFSRNPLNIFKLTVWYSKIYCACCGRSWFDWIQTRHSLLQWNFCHKWKSVWWEPYWVGLQLKSYYRFLVQHPATSSGYRGQHIFFPQCIKLCFLLTGSQLFCKTHEKYILSQFALRNLHIYKDTLHVPLR